MIQIRNGSCSHDRFSILLKNILKRIKQVICRSINLFLWEIFKILLRLIRFLFLIKIVMSIKMFLLISLNVFFMLFRKNSYEKTGKWGWGWVPARFG